MRKYRIIYLLALVTMTGTYIWTNEKEPLILLLILILLPILTGSLAWVEGKNARLLVTLPDTCVVGQNVELVFWLTKKNGNFIGKVEFSLQFENVLYDEEEEKKIRIFPDAQKKTEYVLPLDTQQCGKVKIRANGIYVYDILGLFRWKKEWHLENSILIFPKPIFLHVLLTQRPKAIETGEIYDEQIRGEDVSETFDLREYQKGDSIRTVHWKLSGKTDDLLVREFSRPANYNTILLFEFHRRPEEDSDSKHSINMIASLTRAVMEGLLQLNMGHQIGFVIRGTLRINTIDSQDAAAQMVESMMSMRAEKGSTDMIQTFLKLEMYRQYTKVIYITERFDERAVSELSRLVNVSIIVPQEGEEDYYDSSGGYDVLALSSGEMEKNAIYLYI